MTLCCKPVTAREGNSHCYHFARFAGHFFKVIRMSKDLFDMKRLPVDRVAARVVGKGVDWTPNKVIQTGDSDLPLPVFPAYNIKNPQQRREVQAMIGRKRGRLTIIGLAVTQGAKNFKNNSDEFDGCERCRELLFLKREEVKRRTGKWVDWKELM